MWFKPKKQITSKWEGTGDRPVRRAKNEKLMNDSVTAKWLYVRIWALTPATIQFTHTHTQRRELLNTHVYMRTIPFGCQINRSVVPTAMMVIFNRTTLMFLKEQTIHEECVSCVQLCSSMRISTRSRCCLFDSNLRPFWSDNWHHQCENKTTTITVEWREHLRYSMADATRVPYVFVVSTCVQRALCGAFTPTPNARWRLAWHEHRECRRRILYMDMDNGGMCLCNVQSTVQRVSHHNEWIKMEKE